MVSSVITVSQAGVKEEVETQVDRQIMDVMPTMLPRRDGRVEQVFKGTMLKGHEL